MNHTHHSSTTHENTTAHAHPKEHAEKSHPASIHFSKPVQDAVNALGYTKWTTIQEMSMPLILAGKDVMGQSHTGSGKTAAFGLPIIEKIVPNGRVHVLILVPTRELCEQVMHEMRKFAQFKRISITAVYGGASMGRQIQQLRRTDIVVGTPGRVLDHIERGTLRLNEVNTLVLDEADRMLDMGFIKDMKRIIQHVPKERQTLLFSATFSHEIQEIAAQHMKHAQLIKAQTHVDKGKLTQVYYDLDKQADKKFGLLIHILKNENPPHAIVFGGTRRNVDRIERSLNENGIKAESIHGGLSQNQRKHTLNHFHHGDVHVLVASDVAARGLDIKSVSHVINFDIPRTPEDYIHRSGRTARAGEEGKIISLLTPNDYAYFRSIIRDKSHHITQEALPEFENITYSKGKKHTINKEHEEKHFSRERPHYKGKPGSFPPRNRTRVQEHGKSFAEQEAEGQPYGPSREKRPSFGHRKPFVKHASYGKKPHGGKPYGKKPFSHSTKNQEEDYPIVKHFGLKHAKKEEK